MNEESAVNFKYREITGNRGGERASEVASALLKEANGWSEYLEAQWTGTQFPFLTPHGYRSGFRREFEVGVDQDQWGRGYSPPEMINDILMAFRRLRGDVLVDSAREAYGGNKPYITPLDVDLGSPGIEEAVKFIQASSVNTGNIVAIAALDSDLKIEGVEIRKSHRLPKDISAIVFGENAFRWSIADIQVRNCIFGIESFIAVGCCRVFDDLVRVIKK